MESKKYDIQIIIIAVLMVVVLLSGMVFTMPQKQIEKEFSVAQTVEDVAFVSQIDTAQAETYDSILETLVKLRNEYSDTVKLYTLGESVRGKKIPMITMGNGDKKALVVAAIHAREHITTKFILKLCEEYCFAAQKGNGMYGTYNLKQLFSEYTIYIVPCVNPDGLDVITGKIQPKKGVGIDKITEYKANYNGVDLNRNFPLAWDDIDNGVTNPYGYYYKGDKQGSEPETKALMKLCRENNFEFLISVHIKGDLIYWGDKYDESRNDEYYAFAKSIGDACGFYITEPTIKASSYGGGFENWFRHTYKKPGICVELSNIENKIKPCTDENYKEFYAFTEYEESKYLLCEAMRVSK